MRLILVFLISLFMVPLTAASEEPTDPKGAGGKGGEALPLSPRVYVIETQGKMLGYLVESHAEAEDSGRKITIYSTRTFLKTGADGTAQAETALSESEYKVDAETGDVLSAHIAHYQGNAFHFQSADFFDERVELRTTRHAGETEKSTIALPRDVVVPFSPTAPVLSLMKSGQAEAKLPILDLSAGKVETVTVRKKGEESLNFDGKSYECHRFLLDWGDLYRETLIWVTGEGVLVKKEMSVQGMVFRPASKKTAERLIPREAVPAPFISVAAKVESRAGLTFLMLRAKLDCPAVTDASQLNFENQTFHGRVEDGVINGVFKIRSAYLDRTHAMPIFSDHDEAARYGDFLKPEPLIECTDPLIVKTAHEIVARLRNRWHAVHSLGMHVLKHVTYDLGAECSAVGALDHGRANAAGLSRLHVALCRSLGIPARVVRGAVYSLADGSAGFVEHAWTEVFLGSAGWVSMDVTAGALTYLDAGHLRLGLSAKFRPRELEIMDFIPKPEDQRPAALCREAPFPIPRNETHVYDYYVNDDLWGTEKVIFRGEETLDGQPVYVFSSKVDLKTISGHSLSKVRKDGRLVTYSADLGEVSSSCRVEGDQVHCRLRQGESEQEKTVALPAEGFFFDTHQIFQLGFMLSRLDLEPGNIVQVSAFQPAVMRTLTLQVERKKDGSRKINEKTCRVCEFELLAGGQKMCVLLSPEGLLLEEKEIGGLSRVRWRGVE